MTNPSKSHQPLKVRGLKKTFPPKRHFFLMPPYAPAFKAVDKIDLDLFEGEFLGLLGPNGAGKTTTIEMLLGTLKPTEGSIEYFGENFFKNRHKALQHITHASAYHKLPATLTVKQALFLFGRLYGMRDSEIRKELSSLSDQFGVTPFFHKTIQELSAGQTTRVMLLKAFLPNPRIALLDEPTASLDPDIADDLRKYIKQLKGQRSLSLVLTSHNMEEVAELCDRVLVLKNGQIIEEDTPEKLAKKVALHQLCLSNPSPMHVLISFLEQKGARFFASEKNVRIELEDFEIPPLLKEIALKGVDYKKIEIETPTLEDFFIHIARRK